MSRNLGMSVVPLTAGCRKDVEKLLNAFRNEESLSFDSFSKHFREVNFVTIFMGRISEAELFEFSEKLLQMAVSYAMAYHERNLCDYYVGASTEAVFNDSGEHTLQERIFGLYLTYSLYYVQPGNYVSQIPVTPEQSNDLAAFVEGVLRPGGYYDAILAYFRLVSYGAFRIVAFEKEHNPLLHRRFDKSVLNGGIVPQFEELSLLKSFANDPILTQVDLINERYQAAKKESGIPDLAIVDVIKCSVTELYEDVMENAQQRERRASAVGGKSLGYQPKASRFLLKEKAYKTKTVHSRHRRHRIPSSQSVSSPPTDVLDSTTISPASPSTSQECEAVISDGGAEKSAAQKQVKQNKSKRKNGGAEKTFGSGERKTKSKETKKKRTASDQKNTCSSNKMIGISADAKEEQLDMIFQKLREEAMKS